MPLFRRPDLKAPQKRCEAIALELEGEELCVSVRRHPQARRLTLRVRSATRDVTVTAPPHVTLAAAGDFVRRHREWIRVRLGRLPDVVRFEDGALVPLRGEPHRVIHVPQERGTLRTGTDATGAPALHVAGAAPHVARRVVDHMKREARRDLTAAVRRHALALGVEVGRITLRDTSSRWGSCSARGDLSFSWRLIMAPPFVLDYLAAHEVAHRLELNHGPRFWAAVERIFPARREAESWLRHHGASLHRYGE
ncbi:M48 family metallopeptidase [Xanthobacter agilis]|uniref:Metal-dependent hydrolase n=1 Tax=Xanthobacter agilis TaxID=47492 RepID=A0ABU0L8U2_XANAG|nr:SprT family zinc-dependent metalloprotease [Xanthobacter agilis]MDQ0503536.1 putative metal-dependent hydrolase [Xanthobacter agilis]